MIMRLLTKDGNSIGIVTSGTMSPYHMNWIGIGLGYVSTEHSTVDSVIFIRIQKK
jgi:aminomethyltransferase